MTGQMLHILRAILKSIGLTFSKVFCINVMCKLKIRSGQKIPLWSLQLLVTLPHLAIYSCASCLFASLPDCERDCFKFCFGMGNQYLSLISESLLQIKDSHEPFLWACELLIHFCIQKWYTLWFPQSGTLKDNCPSLFQTRATTTWHLQKRHGQFFAPFPASHMARPINLCLQQH